MPSEPEPVYGEPVHDVSSTPTNTARTELVAQHDHISSREHAWLKSCKANKCHPRVMSQSLPHLTLTTSTSSVSPISSISPIFPTVSPSQTSPMILNPYIPCDVPRLSGGSTQIPSLVGYETKSVEIKAIDAEAIEPDDLEPRRTELGRNLWPDLYQRQERFMRNSVTGDVDEFGKVGAEMSYLQSQRHSD